MKRRGTHQRQSSEAADSTAQHEPGPRAPASASGSPQARKTPRNSSAGSPSHGSPAASQSTTRSEDRSGSGGGSEEAVLQGRVYRGGRNDADGPSGQQTIPGSNRSSSGSGVQHQCHSALSTTATTGIVSSSSSGSNSGLSTAGNVSSPAGALPAAGPCHSTGSPITGLDLHSTGSPITGLDPHSTGSPSLLLPWTETSLTRPVAVQCDSSSRSAVSQAAAGSRSSSSSRIQSAGMWRAVPQPSGSTESAATVMTSQSPGVGVGRLVCQHCGRVYKYRSALKHHEDTHSAGHECTVCGKSLSTQRTLAGHMKTLHAFEFCELCWNVYEGRRRLNEHMDKEHGHETVCPHCGKSFLSHSGLRQHVRQTHT